MADFIQVEIQTANNAKQELLIAVLSSAGFEGFEEADGSLRAFIASENFSEETMGGLAREFEFSWHSSVIPDQNWNELWESNFQPVQIESFVAIRAEFHQPVDGVLHEIVITPKMSFGTGHHATTHMMILQMQQLNFRDKEVFDFGTGTGVLAILAEKLGASNVFAVDNDEWSIANAAENIQRNNCTAIKLLLAARPPGEKKFDIILANINKNIILDHLAILAGLLEKNGLLVLSGLLKADEADLLREAGMVQIHHQATMHRNDWICMLFSCQAMEINL